MILHCVTLFSSFMVPHVILSRTLSLFLSCPSFHGNLVDLRAHICTKSVNID
jgi:hypothetical protein